MNANDYRTWEDRRAAMDEEDYRYDRDGRTCPACGAENLPLGRLGRVDHYSCRMCGAHYNNAEEVYG
jgi:rubredoxin